MNRQRAMRYLINHVNVLE